MKPQTSTMPTSTYIKARQRVRDLAEVFTHEREVNAMLDMIPDMFPQDSIRAVDKTFLEPACGSGNFLEAILRRKLAGIRFSRIRSAARYEHWLLRALASIYGVDICSDNVMESRSRLLETVRSHYHLDANTLTPTKGFATAAQTIVTHNILCADFLADAARTEVIFWKPMRKGCFLRHWSILDNSSEAFTMPDLFNPVPQPKQDAEPIHYSKIGSYTTPVAENDNTASEPAQ